MGWRGSRARCASRCEARAASRCSYTSAREILRRSRPRRSRVERSAYAELRNGQLNPQDAFLTGRIQVEGDLQLAMQLALAAVAPD